eukprot:scaffold10856_cov78-Skeletonema_dohrnii-CCMP3373.AAC.1
MPMTCRRNYNLHNVNPTANPRQQIYIYQKAHVYLTIPRGKILEDIVRADARCWGDVLPKPPRHKCRGNNI